MATNLLSINDLTPDQLAHMLDVGDAYQNGTVGGRPLADKSVAMLFEKPSLRTRVTFEVAIHDLGGHPVYLGRDEVGLDSRESVEDVAQALERWVSIIVARVFHHSTLERLANETSIPVVNALSDLEHPCQALADLMTIRQRMVRHGHSDLSTVTVAYVGDANNCALSLALGCAALSAQFRIAAPDGFGFTPGALAAVNARYHEGMRVQVAASPAEAVDGVDAVYTDVWTSMGQENESAARRKAFAGFQVDQALLDRARPAALLMHPMPAHYGEEVPAGMLNHPQSVAFDQAENRLHVQKAALRFLVTGE